jgi:hypothetical protein
MQLVLMGVLWQFSHGWDASDWLFGEAEMIW